MTRFSCAAAALLALAAAAPALAQPAPPAAPQGTMRDRPRPMEGHGGMHGRAFASMSEAGRATMREQMRGGGDRREDREAVKAARDRMLVLLDAERLDTAALRRAMDDERKAANASRERAQAALLAGFTKLSVADRKAFVADARAMKSRVEGRVKAWRDRGGAPALFD